MRPLNCFLSHARGLNSLQFKQKCSPANSCYFFYLRKKDFFFFERKGNATRENEKGLLSLRFLMLFARFRVVEAANQ